MLNKAATQQRLDEIAVEVKRLYRNPNLSDKMATHLGCLLDEGESLMTKLETHKKAASMSSFASPAEWDGSLNPGGFADGTGQQDAGPWFKGLGPNIENQIRPVSMYSIDKTQIKALQQAGQQGHGFKVQLGQKGI